MNGKILDRYGKILALALSTTSKAERATAYKQLRRLEGKHPGVKAAWASRRVTGTAEAKAKSHGFDPSSMPGGDFVRELLKEHAEKILSSGFSRVEEAFASYINDWSPPQAPDTEPDLDDDEDWEELSEDDIEDMEYAMGVVTDDDDDSYNDLTLELSIPLDLWQRNPLGVLAWLHNQIEEDLEALE